MELTAIKYRKRNKNSGFSAPRDLLSRAASDFNLSRAGETIDKSVSSIENSNKSRLKYI